MIEAIEAPTKTEVELALAEALARYVSFHILSDRERMLATLLEASDERPE